MVAPAIRLSAFACAVLLAASLAGCGGGGMSDTMDSGSRGSGAGTGLAAMTPTEQAGADAIFTLVNQERAKAGLAPLVLDTIATRTAYDHALDMRMRGYFDHDTPEGMTPGQRLAGAGCMFRDWAENIAEGDPTPADVMLDWMNSPEHRANMMNSQFTHMGIGVCFSGSTPYWVEDFVAK